MCSCVITKFNFGPRRLIYMRGKRTGDGRYAHTPYNVTPHTHVYVAYMHAFCSTTCHPVAGEPLYVIIRFYFYFSPGSRFVFYGRQKRK